jgi:dihydropteroate synthase
MGILNVTPDSFSDGGKYYSLEKAIERGVEIANERADIIDVGGESTRPNAEMVSEEEELRRVIPVIRELARRVKVPISIDTQKTDVAEAALEAGATIVNDIAAYRFDPKMLSIVAQSGAGYVLMHMQGSPQTMQKNPVYQDVVADIAGFFKGGLKRIEQAGVNREQAILDVGIGFGKTVEHNVALISDLKQFCQFERPTLLGVSRKSFIGHLLGASLPERLPASLACACWAVENGVNIIRAHDVSDTVQALRMMEAILSRSK